MLLLFLCKKIAILPSTIIFFWKKIKQYDLKGNYIKTWESIASASKELGLDASAITKCCKNKRNKCGNYSWQYDNEKSKGQDGYAGAKGVTITKFQITIE